MTDKLDIVAVKNNSYLVVESPGPLHTWHLNPLLSVNVCVLYIDIIIVL